MLLCDADDWLRALFLGDGDAWLPGSLFCGTFVVTEDLSCVAGGIFAAEGVIALPIAIAACATGIWLGDLCLYLIGWASARGLLRWRWARRRLAGHSGAAWRRAFERHGATLLFGSRFLPGTRVPLYLAAGAIGYPPVRFAVVLGVAVLLWTPVLVCAAALWGRVVLDVVDGFGAYAWFAVPLALLVAWSMSRALTLTMSWRGRRLLRGRWLRLRHWEYWPPVVVFAPVALELLRLALVHRTPLVFTACNRGIPFGGLFGESKGDILALLGPPSWPRPAAAAAWGVRTAAWRRLPRAMPIDERVQVVARFLAADGRCVLKPDQGERGNGVAVVRDAAAARAWLAACPYDALVQQFVGGEEYGIAWCRDPRSGRGCIDSIAHKVLPAVVGDGRRDLERLILADDRTLAMATAHLRRHAAELTRVPAEGEVVPLGDLGTHARGATFYDARSLVTPALLAAFEAWLDGVDGIDFGRFDVRAPGPEAVRQGIGIEVLEFNGVTGEAAHVYQPGYPWWRGVRDIVCHMRRAVAIGAHNRRSGHRPARLRELVAVLFQAWRRPAFEAEAAVAAAAKEPSR